jgi:uncharacterized membrane protein
MPAEKTTERGIHVAFLLAIVLKGLDGLLEIVLGLILIFTDEFSDVAFFLSNNFIDDPNNFFATHLRAFASQSHEAFVIGGLYLIAHGLVKSFISGSLLRNYSWAYPAAIALLALFICYEIIRVAFTGSISLTLFAIFDIVTVWLIAYEYRKLPHRA